MKKRPKYHAQGEHEKKEGFNQSLHQREKTAEEAFRNPPFFPLLTDMETEARRGDGAQLGSRKPEGWSSPLRERVASGRLQRGCIGWEAESTKILWPLSPDTSVLSPSWAALVCRGAHTVLG